MKLGSYLSSLSCNFREFRCKALLVDEKAFLLVCGHFQTVRAHVQAYQRRLTDTGRLQTTT